MKSGITVDGLWLTLVRKEDGLYRLNGRNEQGADFAWDVEQKSWRKKGKVKGYKTEAEATCGLDIEIARAEAGINDDDEE
jgi:hypothetical protein